MDNDLYAVLGQDKKLAFKEFDLRSYAKINLFLDVLSKMSNGYHSILTLFSEIELFDYLKFSLTKYHDIKLLSNIESLSSKDNLVYKIAIYIQAKYSVRYGAKIILTKNIPIAAGLGGGSSNAATTIMGLNCLWELNLSSDEMHFIAQQFGSDINFFLSGFQAIGTGRGEVIETVLNEIHFKNILLVKPDFEILSSEAYEAVELSDSNGNLPKLLETSNPEYCYNKLEEGILNKYICLNEIYDLLYTNSAKKVILSGSGSTVIGFFDSSKSCVEAQKQIKNLGFWTHKTSTRRRQSK